MITKFIVISLCLVNIVQITTGEEEPEKERFFRNDYTYIESSQSFYKLHTLHKNWEDAKAKCETEGTTLFYPEDNDEALAVISYWNTTQPSFHWVFIGVADWNVKEVFETIDGRPITAVYNNWGYGEPNNADDSEGCVILRRDGTLNDDKCGNKYPFICKKTLGTLQWNEKCSIADLQYEYSVDLNRCYKFHLTPRNWTDAHAVCNAEESYLAVINSEAERNHLVNITALAPKETVTGDYLYGGVHLGFQNKNGWTTVKGVPLRLSGYNQWANQQPDGAGIENCGSMFFSGELNDIGCFQKMFFICEHEVQLRTEVIDYRFNTPGQPEVSEEDAWAKIFGTPPIKT